MIIEHEPSVYMSSIHKRSNQYNLYEYAIYKGIRIDYFIQNIAKKLKGLDKQRTSIFI